MLEYKSVRKCAPTLQSGLFVLVDAVTRRTTPPGSAGRLTGPANFAIQANGDPRWHSRGYLPHFDSPGVLQHVTYHLADSISREAIQRLQSEVVFLPDSQRDAARRERLEAWIDSGHGSCTLRDPVAAGIVQSSFLNFDTQRYRLLAWVVMPNHVHALIEPIHGWSVAKIVATWKKFTALRINEHLTVEGRKPLHPLWHREYWDRFMRDQRHFEQTISYIHNNPVKAGLVADPEQWPWSSASLGTSP